jgi:hypothetical protein
MSESVFVNTGSVSDQSVTTDESSPRIIVFAAGAQSRVEAAVDVAGRLYPGRRLVFVCVSQCTAYGCRNVPAPQQRLAKAMEVIPEPAALSNSVLPCTTRAIPG